MATSLFFLMLVWRQCRRKCRDRPDLRWAFSLASPTQVSLTGYAVAGVLDIAFWVRPFTPTPRSDVWTGIDELDVKLTGFSGKNISPSCGTSDPMRRAGFGLPAAALEKLSI